LRHIWAGQCSTGTLVRWAALDHGWTVQVVYPQLQRCTPDYVSAVDYEPGFRVIPKRWVVERTFSSLVR
jgi:hypothetical protein